MIVGNEALGINAGDAETVGVAGVMLPVEVVASVPTGVDPGDAEGYVGPAAGTTVETVTAKPGHLPQVIYTNTSDSA